MGFIDSYKHLEKLCGEILRDDRRVSAYIDAMFNIPNGSYYVRTWNEDLKKLKHYRWVRNKISHEPDCTEQNMCGPEDTLWINDFYSRIMNGTDPLTLYYKATRTPAAVKPSPTQKQYIPSHSQSNPYDQPNWNRSPARNPIGCATLIVIALLMVAALVMFSNIL